MIVSHRAGAFAIALVAASLGVVIRVTGSQPAAEGPRVEISFAATARTEAVTGMVYLAVSRDNQRSPIEQTSPTGAPLFSTYVEALAPGTTATIAADRRGHPPSESARYTCR